MARLELGPIGASIEVNGRDGYAADAVALEKLGFSTIWLPGGQLATMDPITEILRATTRIGVGSAILAAEAFDAATVAAGFAAIEAAHPGRFIAGLGGGHGPRPLAAMGAYLDELDAATPPVPASARVLAALGPRKLELARDRSAGAVPMLVTPEYTAQARAVLGSGPVLSIQQFVAVDQDAERVRAAARVPLGFLAGVGGYAANFRRMGFAESDVAGLGDRLVDAMVPWGDADAVAARVTEHLDAGADQVTLAPLTTGTSAPALDQLRLLAERLIG
ncbi:putative F420-dependent oxidoreductase [Murinocardiopsis flavida]|uniref:Putative F420-dependent oxidoreductase n=1 Tax=Murinocardiopsis flavida TaxID=645275 RepID=A0A2P8CXG3_9ACTN|nr:TIGR03620 family F420-dependent LLM class oxidoreductase [Murinocardiopsis flavida]PSK89662.1 putative F420-dependent oxidoreductase [Murinocardiopsis flavida]